MPRKEARIAFWSGEYYTYNYRTRKKIATSHFGGKYPIYKARKLGYIVRLNIGTMYQMKIKILKPIV